MAVKIKLKRVGKIHAPQYRIIVADSRKAPSSRAIEEIGIYQPLEDPSILKVESERVQYWLSVGAQPTEAVAAILKVTGDWQKFKGEPGAEGTLKVAEPKADKKVVYQAAVAEAASEPKTPAPKKTEVKEAVEEAAEKVEEVVEAVAEKVEEVVEAAVDAVKGEDKADEAPADSGESAEAASDEAKSE